MTQKERQPVVWRHTDPRAVVALQRWIEQHHSYMIDGTMGPVVDPCANFGGVLELICDFEDRYAIEINPAYMRRLLDRVPSDAIAIGSSLETMSWPAEAGLIILDLPTSGGSATAFLEKVILMRKKYGYTAGAAILCTTTFTRAAKTVAILKNDPPHHCLGMSFRLSNTESGVGTTGQSHDWLVWLPEPCMDKPTIYDCLPRPVIPPSVISDFKAMSSP